MGRINKYSKELKLKVVHEYIKGIKSLGNIAYELGCCKETVRGWVMMFKECGEEVFNDKPHNKSYTKKFKETVVKEYFEGKDDIIEKIIKLESTKLQVFLYSFANIIDDIGIDEAVKKVNSLL